MEERNIFETIKTLELMIKRLKKIGEKADIARSQNWLVILKGNPSKNDINQVWSEVQLIGRHMGYMDYLDNEYREISSKLKNQMLDLIAIVRKNPTIQKDKPD
jgi:hypothetical protein